MKLTITPESFPKRHWPAEKPQLKLNRFAAVLVGILGSIVSLFNMFGIYLLTVYYLLPFDLVLPGNLVSRFILFLIGFVLATYLSILIYEGSQLLVGVLIGYRAALLQVGPLALVRTAAGWRLRRIGHEFLLLGGVNYSGPLTAKHLRLRHTIYIISGYLITALFWSILVNINAIFSVDRVSLWGAVVVDLLVISTTYALWQKLLTVLNGLFVTLLQNPGHWAQLQQIMLATLCASGVRPRSLDPVAVAKLVTDAKETPFESSAQLFAYERAIDCGNLVEATHRLNQALQSLHRCLVAESRINVMLFAAEYEVTYGENPQRASEWLAHCQIQPASPMAHELHQHYLRVKAAILLAEGEWLDARRIALESQEMLKGTFDLGGILPATEKLDRILQQTTHKLAFQPQTVTQSAPASKIDSPLQLKPRIIGNIYDWASFAFIYFLLINFNMVAASQSVVHKYWGDQYASTGQYQQAIIAYTKANAAFPDWATGLTERGKVYSIQGDYPRAVADFSQVIERTTFADEELYLSRGAAYYHLGERELAEADFSQALALADSVSKQQVIKMIQQIRDTNEQIEE